MYNSWVINKEVQAIQNVEGPDYPLAIVLTIGSHMYMIKNS